LKPLDRESIRTTCSRFPRVHVVENHSTVGGLASAVCETLAQAGSSVQVIAHGVPDQWAPAGSLDFVRARLGLDAHSIAETVSKEAGA
jgi:transketolase